TLRSPRQYNCYCESFVLITPGSLRLVAHGPGRARDLIDRGVDVRREIHGQVVRLGGKQDDIGKDHDTALRWEDARGHVRRPRRDLGLARMTHVGARLRPRRPRGAGPRRFGCDDRRCSSWWPNGIRTRV